MVLMTDVNGINMERLKEIEERLRKATSSPWHIKTGVIPRVYSNDKFEICEFQTVYSPHWRDDIELIAHSPSDTQYLLKQLKAAIKRIETLESIRKSITKRYRDLTADITQLHCKNCIVAKEYCESFVDGQQPCNLVVQFFMKDNGIDRKLFVCAECGYQTEDEDTYKEHVCEKQLGLETQLRIVNRQVQELKVTLERQAKEPCESCEYWKCRDAKYCPKCGRKLEGQE